MAASASEAAAATTATTATATAATAERENAVGQDRPVQAGDGQAQHDSGCAGHVGATAARHRRHQHTAAQALFAEDACFRPNPSQRGRGGRAMTKLPAPEQWVLHRMNEMEVAEMIEEYIDFVDGKGKSVRLPSIFVRHFRQRFDDVCPTVVSIATLPIVLADGVLLAPDGLDPDRGIAFNRSEERRVGTA